MSNFIQQFQGGYDGSVFLPSIECLDPGESHGGVWREVAEMSSGRSGCGSVVGYQPCLPQPEGPSAQSNRSKFRVSRHWSFKCLLIRSTFVVDGKIFRINLISQSYLLAKGNFYVYAVSLKYGCHLVRYCWWKFL